MNPILNGGPSVIDPRQAEPAGADATVLVPDGRSAVAASDEALATSGYLIRQARRARHLSQLDLALKVGVSQRHLSFIETGRAKASRDMLVAIADALGIGPANTNQLLLAGGFAPRYAQRPLAHRQMKPVREALEHLLKAHDPMPAWVVDQAWNLVLFNRGADDLVASLGAPRLSAMPGPLNLLALMLDPKGLRPLFLNFDEVAAHLYLQTRLEASQSTALATVLARVEGWWPRSVGRHESGAAALPPPVMTARIASPQGPLAFFSMFTTFGTALDITVASLRVEHLFPADDETAKRLAAWRG